MKEQQSTARLATIDELLQTTVQAFLSPVPKKATFRLWLNRARVPRFKTNPAAIRGGGSAYYSVAAVEKLLRGRTMAR